MEDGIETRSNHFWGRKIAIAVGKIKINVDATLKNQERKTAWCIVVRDEAGKLLKSWTTIPEISKKLLTCFSDNKEDFVSKCIERGNWKWPQGRKLSADVGTLQQFTPASFILRTGISDYTVWENDTRFSVKRAMEDIRPVRAPVTRYKLV
ncbi:hypothetical protein ACH5RR_007147 [Cinchona calisaya]|uniref:Uncharacterized protein n=1 Tax=Cinchona calisaya TaxID=153742 RepID=A0ABD3AR02_9GENT